MIAVGWLIYAAIYLAFAEIATAAAAWVCFLIYGAFYALTEPAERTLVANLVGPDRQGLAFGWFNFAIGVVALPANLLFGWIYDQYGAAAAFTWGAAWRWLPPCCCSASGGSRRRTKGEWLAINPDALAQDATL